MKYITAAEAAEKWGISKRTVSRHCLSGKIEGARKIGRDWLLPEDTPPMTDGRKSHPSNAKTEEISVSTDILMMDDERKRINPFALLLNCTYFESNDSGSIPEAARIYCEARDIFLRGDIDLSSHLLTKNLHLCDEKYKMLYYYEIACNYFYSGNFEKVLYYTKKSRELTLRPENSYEHTLINMSLMENMNREIDLSELEGNIPQELSHYIIHYQIINDLRDCIVTGKPANYLLIEANLNILHADGYYETCVILHTAFAMYCRITMREDLYRTHIRKALDIAIPRGWCMPFAIYPFSIDFHEIKNSFQPMFFERVRKLSDKVLKTMAVYNPLFTFPAKSNAQNTKILFLVACGKTNKEIATALDLQEHKVKNIISEYLDTYNVQNRHELGEFFKKHIVL